MGSRKRSTGAASSTCQTTSSDARAGPRLGRRRSSWLGPGRMALGRGPYWLSRFTLMPAVDRDIACSLLVAEGDLVELGDGGGLDGSQPVA